MAKEKRSRRTSPLTEIVRVHTLMKERAIPMTASTYAADSAARHELTANEYQRQALRSALLDRPLDQQLLNAALGLAGEAGEITDLVKKVFFHGHDQDDAKLKEELGDLLWYVALACHSLNCQMSELMQGNIDKLLRRYPDKFNFDASRNRAE